MNELYLLNTEQLNDTEKYDKAFNMLSEMRRDKLTHIRSGEKKLCSLGAGCLISLGLTERGISFADERIALSEKGKPYLPDHPDIHFNVSHTTGLVICAFSDSPIGVDCEKIRAVDEKTVRRVLSDSEYSAYENAAHDAREKVFFEHWTRKEAFLKNIGIGITTDLRTIDRDYDDIIKKLNFYSVNSLEGFSITVCTVSENPKLTNTIL